VTTARLRVRHFLFGHSAKTAHTGNAATASSTEVLRLVAAGPSRRQRHRRTGGRTQTGACGTRQRQSQQSPDAEFDKEVLKSDKPVVVDFWAEWCGPCRMIAPALEEISGSLAGKVKIVKLNVDENPATAAKYGVMSIPTLMLFKNGELASRQVGAAPKQKLEQWITATV
jgi:thioredoxin 1